MSNSWQRLADQLAEAHIREAVARPLGALVLPTGAMTAHDGLIYVPTPIECKADWKAALTKNCFFEVRNTYRNCAAGLKATQAQIWAHYAHGHGVLFTFPPSVMLEWLRNEYRRKTGRVRLTAAGCGDNNSQGLLVQVSLIKTLPFVQSQAWAIAEEIALYAQYSTTQKAGQTR